MDGQATPFVIVFDLSQLPKDVTAQSSIVILLDFIIMLFVIYDIVLFCIGSSRSRLRGLELVDPQPLVVYELCRRSTVSSKVLYS